MVKPEKFGYLHLVYHFTIPLKTLLFKTVIVFTIIYFKSYCKIPALSSKSVL